MSRETPRQRKRLGREIAKNRDKYLLLAPFFLLFTVFTLIPVLISIPISFTEFNMVQMPHWVGWDNFARLFVDDDVFLIAVKNTIIFAFLTGPISYFACLFFAWLINDLSRGLRTVMTFVFYAPSLCGNVYFIWQFIFSGDSYGLINGLLMKLGVINDPILWLKSTSTALTVVIIVQLWLSLGAGFLSFIAGLQGIDTSLYEAGAIDGIRNRFQELLYITLPSMGPQLLFGAVMHIGSSFAAGGVAVALTGFPSTENVTTTIVTHAMDYGTIRYEMGYAAAISLVLFVVMILTNAFIRTILKKVASDV